MKQETAFFDLEHNATGAICSRLVLITSNLFDLLGMNLALVLVNFFIVLSVSILGIAYGWKLGLVCVFAALPAILISGLIRIRLSAKLKEDTLVRFASSVAIATEATSAIRTVDSLTLERNIAMGLPNSEATDSQVEEACKAANIYDFVMSLPDGLGSEFGPRGTKLSGGQRQRVAIARALIRDPKILLLDEATSALDTESERIVQATLSEATKGGKRTTIAVAHRLSTIKDADCIFVFQGGRIVEAGSHGELMERGKGVL
jgi:ABC-type multidrug transport system fused ATPase/permease subunit